MAKLGNSDQTDRGLYEFDFFQLMRLFECAFPDMPRLGESKLPGDDPVRLGQQPSPAFAPSALADFEIDSDEHPGFPRLEVFFFGMFGPMGPLPLHLTQYARDRLYARGEYGRRQDTGAPLQGKDASFARFADVFHHRMLCLFYRAWATAQPTVSLDRLHHESGTYQDPFATYVGSLCGLGTRELRDRDAMPDLAKLSYAGRLACPTRNAEGLRIILTDLLQLPVDIEEFVGHWMPLPKECRWQLGKPSRQGTTPNTLGVATTCGDAVWDRQHKVRVVIGPLGWNDFQQFVPDVGLGEGTEDPCHVKRRDRLQLLVAAVRNYIGDEMAWDVKVALKQDAFTTEGSLGTVGDLDSSPWCALGKGTRLGCTSWLVSDQMERDADDFHLTFDVDKIMPDGFGDG